MQLSVSASRSNSGYKNLFPHTVKSRGEETSHLNGTFLSLSNLAEGGPELGTWIDEI